MKPSPKGRVFRVADSHDRQPAQLRDVFITCENIGPVICLINGMFLTQAVKPWEGIFDKLRGIPGKVIVLCASLISHYDISKIVFAYFNTYMNLSQDEALISCL